MARPAPAAGQPRGMLRALLRRQAPQPAGAEPETLSADELLERVREVMSAVDAREAAAAPPVRLQPGQRLALSVARSGAVVAMLDGEVLDAGAPDAVLAVVRQWLPPS